MKLRKKERKKCLSDHVFVIGIYIDIKVKQSLYRAIEGSRRLRIPEFKTFST